MFGFVTDGFPANASSFALLIPETSSLDCKRKETAILCQVPDLFCMHSCKALEFALYALCLFVCQSLTPRLVPAPKMEFSFAAKCKTLLVHRGVGF